MLFLKTFEGMFDEMPMDPFSESLIDVLDMNALNKELTVDVKGYMKGNDPVKAKEKNDSTYFVDGPLAIITSKKGSKAVVNNELAGQIAVNDLVKLGIYERNSTGGRGMYPSFNSKFSIDELKKFTDKQLSVKDFMGSRYNYNDRVQANQREFYNFYITK